MQDQPYGLRVLGRIVNVIADEKILNEKEKIDCAKIGAFAFDQINHGYYAIGEQEIAEHTARFQEAALLLQSLEQRLRTHEKAIGGISWAKK